MYVPHNKFVDKSDCTLSNGWTATEYNHHDHHRKGFVGLVPRTCSSEWAGIA
jgi:hypothetical protein